MAIPAIAAGLGIASTAYGLISGAWSDYQDYKNNKWSQAQYIDNRDYQRALQERIFQREDTAMTRALEDYTNAGFSPLAAVGQHFDSGQAVSGPSLPSLTADAHSASAASALGGELTGLAMHRLAAADSLKKVGAEKDAKVQVDAAAHELNMERLEKEFSNNIGLLFASSGADQVLENLRHILRLKEMDKGFSQQKEMEGIQHNNTLSENRAQYQNMADYKSRLDYGEVRRLRREGLEKMLEHDNPDVRRIAHFLNDPAIAESEEMQDYFWTLIEDIVAGDIEKTGRRIGYGTDIADSISGAVGEIGSGVGSFLRGLIQPNSSRRR